MRKLCFVLTSPLVLNAFLRPHLERLARDYDITVCINTSETDVAPRVPRGVTLLPLGIYREIRLAADIKALWDLLRLFRRHKFDLVFGMTPKGGLLAMVAARLTGVSHRVHCFTGQVWAQRSGLSRLLLKSLDRALALCATRLLADSYSQRDFLASQQVAKRSRIEVLANGSMAGVDTQRFAPNSSARERMRAQLGLHADACCVLYVGRLKVEKGVADLLKAFKILLSRYPSLHLVLVGPDEDGLGPLFDRIPNAHRTDYSFAVEDYMAAADIFCLPSYREGFGAVLIEAGAAGLPVVASKIYGITDAVVEGQTAVLHEPGDVDGMVHRIATLIEDEDRRRALGMAGRRRAVEMFRAELVTEAMATFLGSLFAESARDSKAASSR